MSCVLVFKKSLHSLLNYLNLHINLYSARAWIVTCVFVSITCATLSMVPH